MKKNSTKGYVILGIIFALISIIAFVVPTMKTATFWIAYVFTAIAIVAQIVIWKNALGKEDTLKSKFLCLPVVHVGVVYLVVQIVAFAVFAAVPELPIWSAIVACAAILGFSVIFMIAGEAGRGEIEQKYRRRFYSLRNCKLMWNYLLIEKQMRKLKLRCNNLRKRSDLATL